MNEEELLKKKIEELNEEKFILESMIFGLECELLIEKAKKIRKKKEEERSKVKRAKTTCKRIKR